MARRRREEKEAGKMAPCHHGNILPAVPDPFFLRNPRAGRKTGPRETWLE